MNDEHNEPEGDFSQQSQTKPYGANGQPSLVNIVIEQIKKTKKKGEHKEFLIDLVQKYDSGSLTKDDFINESYNKDTDLVNNSFKILNDLKKQMSNPNDLGNQHSPVYPQNGRNGHKRAKIENSNSQSPARDGDNSNSQGQPTQSKNGQNQSDILGKSSDQSNNGDIGEFHSPIEVDGENSVPYKKPRELKAERKKSDQRNTRNNGVNNINYSKVNREGFADDVSNGEPINNNNEVHDSVHASQSNQSQGGQASDEEVTNNENHHQSGHESQNEEQGESEEEGEDEHTEEKHITDQNNNDQSINDQSQNTNHYNVNPEAPERRNKTRKENTNKQNAINQQDEYKSKIFLDRRYLRNLIKQRLQVNGYYNVNKSNRDQIVKSVDETEWQIHEVVKTQMKRMIQNLINIQRNRNQQAQLIKANIQNFIGIQSIFTYTSQSEQLKLNLEQDPAVLQNHCFNQRIKIFEILTIDNSKQLLQQLQQEEYNQDIIHQEHVAKQEVINKKIMQAQAGENAQGEAGTENKKEADDLIDTDTGKKITRKELLQRRNAAEAAKVPLNDQQKQFLLQQQLSKKNELGFNMLRICNQQGKLKHNDNLAKNPEFNNQIKLEAELSLQVLESKDNTKNQQNELQVALNIQGEYIKDALQIEQHSNQYSEGLQLIKKKHSDNQPHQDKVVLRDLIFYLHQQLKFTGDSDLAGVQKSKINQIVYEMINNQNV